MKISIGKILIFFGIAVYFIGLPSLVITQFITREPEVEQVETVKPVGTISKFHKANNEGDEDKFIYVVAYEFESLSDAVEFRGKE